MKTLLPTDSVLYKQWHYRLLPLVCGIIFLLLSLPLWAISESDVLPVEKAFQLSVTAKNRQEIQLNWKIADGYYLYKHRFDVSGINGFTSTEFSLPAGKPSKDEFFGDVETYRNNLTSVLKGNATADKAVIRVKYQGCADIGVCYPPQSVDIPVEFPAVTATTLPPASDGLAALLSATTPAGLGAVDAAPLPPEQAFQFEAIVGDGNTLLLRFTPAKNYYLYRDSMQFKLVDSKNIQTGSPKWPKGQIHRDEHFGEVTVFFNQADVTLPLIRQTADPASITLVTTFQGCQNDGICYPPMTRKINLALPAGKISTVDKTITTDSSPNTEKSQITETSPMAGKSPTADKPPLAEKSPIAETSPISGDSPSTESIQTTESSPASALPDASIENNQRTVRPTTPEIIETASVPATIGFWVAISSALLGGLVLNLMPCVLPVLSLKAMSIASAGGDSSRARRQAFWYSAGVLVAFATVGGIVLALRLLGQNVTWGFQLQQPWLVASLVYLMFVIGLSLSGVITLGGHWSSIGQSLTDKPGYRGDFFTGVLACVVASPCIAPFMGSALAYAFVAPPLAAFFVFISLGLGLALPFLLMGFIPAFSRLLPKPGAWMETLKQILAYPMYLTAVWLVWILGNQRGTDAMGLVLAGLTIITLGIWGFERSRWQSKTVPQILSVIVIGIGLLPIWGVYRLAQPEPSNLQNLSSKVVFSPQRLEQLQQQNRVVFVDMTADWCITCKANQRNVMDKPAFAASLERYNAVHIEGDYTNVNPEISAFLELHRSVGVPLYVVYGPKHPPQVLPVILTQSAVSAALERASGEKTSSQ